MTNFSKYKTEVIGISAEIAIADHFGIDIDKAYRERGSEDVVKQLLPLVPIYFKNYDIPNPIKHVAEKGSLIDFMLKGGKSLSVKSNQKGLGKVAPQSVGQASSKTYFQKFSSIVDVPIPEKTLQKKILFKKTSLEKIDEVIKVYWDNLFNCDYIIHFYDILDGNFNISTCPKALVLEKLNPPEWEKDKFSFSQTLASWNESNTVRYNSVTIGEFQVHNNRDCFKFRFNMKNLLMFIEKKKSI